MKTRNMGVEFIPSKDLADKQGAGKAQQEKVCGYLKKKNRKHGILGSKWNKRWFVLENGILTYAKNKQEIVRNGDCRMISQEHNQMRSRLARMIPI